MPVQLLCSVISICVVFSNRVLALFRGEQPMAWLFGGVHGASLANNLIRCNLSLELEASFSVERCLIGAFFLPHCFVISFRVTYMCIF